MLEEFVPGMGREGLLSADVRGPEFMVRSFLTLLEMSSPGVITREGKAEAREKLRNCFTTIVAVDNALESNGVVPKECYDLGLPIEDLAYLQELKKKPACAEQAAKLEHGIWVQSALCVLGLEVAPTLSPRKGSPLARMKKIYCRDDGMYHATLALKLEKDRLDGDEGVCSEQYTFYKQMAVERGVPGSTIEELRFALVVAKKGLDFAKKLVGHVWVERMAEVRVRGGK